MKRGSRIKGHISTTADAATVMWLEDHMYLNDVSLSAAIKEAVQMAKAYEDTLEYQRLKAEKEEVKERKEGVYGKKAKQVQAE